MMACHHCGQDIPQKGEWRGLTVMGDGGVFWRGIKATRVTPTHAKILLALVARGRASHGSLDMTCASINGGSIKIHIHNVRKRMKDAGIPVEIVNDHGFGYHLELTE